MNRPVYSHSLMLLIFKQYSPIIYSSIPVINMDDIKIIVEKGAWDDDEE